MRINDIRYLPGTNKFGQVYAEKTGNAYVGYVMSGAGIPSGWTVVDAS